jgi:class 3 adenylate cyclase
MASPPPTARRGRFHLSIGLFLTVTLSALVAIPLVIVFAASQGTAIRNTRALLDDKARLIVSQLVSRTQAYLAPAEAAPAFLGGLMERAALDPDDPVAVEKAIQFSFVAAPQLSAMVVVHEQGWDVAAYRQEDGSIGTELGQWREDPRIRQAVEAVVAKGGAAGYWGSPLFVEGAGTTLVSYVQPVLRDRRFRAAVVATIRLASLSAFVKDLSRDLGENAYILYGRDRVIAHKALAEGVLPVSPGHPLPRLGDVNDPVLASMWRPVPGRDDEPWETIAGTVRVREVEVGDEEFVVLYEELDLRTTGEPWLVGGYVAVSAVDSEVRRLVIAAATGVVAILLAILGAVLLARRLSRPIAELAHVSEAVSRLELDGVAPLAPSRLRELDRAVQAFNGMTSAMRLFARYVPRRLVEMLLEGGEAEVMRSRQREVTIMFTDMVGFSQLAGAMTADRCAQFLNHHLSLLTSRIEAEGGIVDKFIGDAVMAVWIHVPGGAEPPGHAAAAVRAARAIRAAVVADNAGQGTKVRVRIGIHSGRVIVGNIGTPTRLNFTVVGDAVNMAQRVENAAKRLRPEAEVAILVSAATAALLADRDILRPLGSHPLPGRDEPVELFAIDDDPC